MRVRAGQCGFRGTPASSPCRCLRRSAGPYDRTTGRTRGQLDFGARRAVLPAPNGRASDSVSYPSDLAAALSGATPGQLQYWRTASSGRPALLVPEYRRGRRWLYSFRDVLALRTFAYLRESVSLQKVRRAVQTLEDLGDEGHLSSYRLVATDDGSIVWITPGQNYVDLVSFPGQVREGVVMEEVFGPFVDKRGNDVLPLFRPVPNIVVNYSVLGGYPVVSGTRVPYDSVSTLVDDGVPFAEVCDFYPSVSPEGASDAVKFRRYVEARSGRLAA